MPGIDHKLTRFVTAIAATSALLVGTLLPAIYFFTHYRSAATELRTIAEMKRVLLEEVVSQIPEMWTFQEMRLKEVLTYHVIDHQTFTAEVHALGGEVLVTHGDQLEAPRMSVRVVLSDNGVPVGDLVMTRSYRVLVLETVVVALLALAFAFGIYVLLRVVPLRVLRRAYHELGKEKERAEVTLFSIGDAVISSDSLERVERMNETAEDLTGWSMREARGRAVSEVFRIVDDKTGEPVADPLQVAIAGGEPVSVSGYLSLRRRDGSLIPIEHNASPVVVDGGQVVGGVLVFRDVTKAREMSRRLSWQARHDSLTGLYNRIEFERRVAGALENYRETRRSFIVLYLDLDRFKIVNDTSGHVAGDELLRQVADIAKRSLRGSDVLARLGGDEFGTVLLGCPLPRAREIANDILTAFGNYRFAWEEKVFTIGVSIGVVESAPEFRDADDLIAAADSACYAAKQAGRNRVSVYEASDETIRRHRIETDWTQQIIQAMAEDRLRVYFQEFQAASDSDPDQGRHIEVLLRMVDRNGNLLLPGTFLPAAERHDLMPSVDLWVIDAAFSRHAEIAARFGADAFCSINLAGQTASDPRLPDQIRELARKHGIDPAKFCFELTETEVLNRLRACSELMLTLSEDGFRFALDDFGGGIGAFSYLRNLPVQMVKINGAYIRDAAASEISHVMVAAINDIGHVMGVRTIAKSVDSNLILDEVRGIGVDYVQGYLLHLPEPLDLNRDDDPRSTADAA